MDAGCRLFVKGSFHLRKISSNMLICRNCLCIWLCMTYNFIHV